MLRSSSTTRVGSRLEAASWIGQLDGVMMQLSSRTAISAIVLISFALTLIEIPRGDWASLAAMSLASGVAALALMAASALLGGRLKAIESLFGGLDRVYLAHK